MNACRDWKRSVALAVTFFAVSASAIAIPPYPPAQKGSRVSSYTCRTDVVTFEEIWDYSASKEKRFRVSINDKNLSASEARRITEAIAASGPFQSNFVVCTTNGFELILMRYTPSAAQLHFGFNGHALARISGADAATEFKLKSRSPIE